MLKLIGHRPVQAFVIALLSALVTACAVITPLYQRALEQASVVVAFRHAPASASQLHLSSTGVLPDIYSGSGTDQATPPLTAKELELTVPGSLRRWFGTAIPSTSVVAQTLPTGPQPSQGRLLWRDGGCEHLRLTKGTCPDQDGQIVVSSEDAANFGWSVGSEIAALEHLPKGTPGAATSATLTVSGIYATPRNSYWDGWALTGVSGTMPDPTGVAHDAWVTGAPTFAGRTPWRNPVQQIDLPLRAAAERIDPLLRIGPAATRLQHAQSQRPRLSASVTVRSDLGYMADKVAEGRAQARTTVPFLMLPLGVLGLVVLWMALGAAAEQRRPELAIARLRGRGVRGARRYLLRELLTLVLAGVPLGCLIALGLASFARHAVLPGSVPLELRFPVWAAGVVSIASVSAAAVLTSVRVSREPLAALLRRVPPRRTGWALGTADAIAVTAAVLTIGVFTTGGLSGPVALAAPAVLALAASLVVARALSPIAARAGRRLLVRGRSAAAVTLLQVARRPGTRGTIALLTVAASLLVFAGNAVAVADRNRRLVADQAVGAPMVAIVSNGSLKGVLDSLRGSHVPAGTVTPVVVVAPQGNDTQTNLYVEPAAFASIAALPAVARARVRALRPPAGDPVVVVAPQGNDTQTNLYVEPAAFATIAAMPEAARARVRALRPPAGAPVRLVGPQLDLRVSSDGLITRGHQVRLVAQLLDADGTVRAVPVGTLPEGTAQGSLSGRIRCAVSCTLTGWRLSTDPGSSVRGAVTLTDLRTRGGPVTLGAPGDWSVVDGPASTLRPQPAGGGGLMLAVDNDGHSELLLQHRWVPATLPAVISGRLPEGSSGHRFAGTGLDRVDRQMTATATVAWLPQSGRDAAVSSLDLAARSGSALIQDAEYQLWFSRADPALLARVTRALEAHQRSVLDVRRESSMLADLKESPSAWSLQLGVLVGIACLLVSGLGLVIATAAGWRHRSRDLAVLRLNGTRRSTVGRVSWAEQLPAIVVGGAVGALTGALAAHFSLSSLPLLPDDPQVDLVDLSLSWSTVLALAGTAVIGAVLLGGLLGLLIARRATLDRVLGSA